MSKSTRSISVRGDFHAGLKQAAKRMGLSVNALVELACGGVPWVGPVPRPKLPKPGKPRHVPCVPPRRVRLQVEPVPVLAHRSGVCALCTSISSQLQLRPFGRDDAMVGVCPRCDSGTVRMRLGPERGYEPSGGLPTMAEVTRAARLLDVKNVARNPNALTYQRTPGYVIERVSRRDGMGQPRDRREARKTFAGKAWARELRFLGEERGFYVFERPDSESLAKQRREQGEPLAGIEQFRSSK